VRNPFGAVTWILSSNVLLVSTSDQCITMAELARSKVLAERKAAMAAAGMVQTDNVTIISQAHSPDSSRSESPTSEID
jgi:hypothetical protein